MYLASLINEVLDSRKDRLLGAPTYFYIVDVLNRAFRKKEFFKFRFELHSDYERNDFSVSGIYDMDSDIRYIVLNFSDRYKTIKINEEKWSEFKFSISQVCQHEAIHKLQWQHRGDLGWEGAPLDFRWVSTSKEEEQEYLNDKDEIDAFAHDIAMEIRYFYPNKDPHKVLKSLNRHNKIWSYRYYKKTFRGTDWKHIRNRLLKKTYKWLPYVTV